MGPTTYKESVGTRDPDDGVPPGDRADPLGSAAVLVSADGMILCGRRSPHTDINPGKIFLFGGFLDPKDLSRPDPVVAGVRREIVEATGIPKDRLRDLICTGLLYDELLPHPELSFTARTRDTLPEVQARTPQDREDAQLDGMPGSPDELARWLPDQQDELVNTALGFLLLNGRHAFGDRWYEATVDALDGGPIGN